MLSTLQYSATVKFNEYANDTETLSKSSFKLMKLIKKSHEQYANDTDTLLKSFKLMKLIETCHEQGDCLKFWSELINVSRDINTNRFS